VFKKDEIRKKAGVPANDSSRDTQIASQAKISAELAYNKWSFFGKVLPTLDYLQAAYVTGAPLTTAAEKSIEANTMTKP
jgi:hypothetical protein